jgi:site-specific recombinase XerD
MINAGKEMEELLGNISSSDLEKLRMLLSIIPQVEPKEIVTLRVFRDEYLNLIKNNRSVSYYKSENIAFNHLIDFFSSRDFRPGTQHSITDITLKDIEDFLTHLQRKVNKGYIVYYRNLKAAFSKAKEWGYVKENYFTKIKLPKRQKIAPAFVNSDQLSAISNQIKNEVVKDVVAFAFYTGMRLDEIVNLRWKNVDLQNCVITVGDENFTTKGRNQRFIPISEEALEALLRMMSEERRVQNFNPLCPSGISLPIQDRDRLLKKWGEFLNGYVFCKRDGSKFTGDYFSKKFKKACIAAEADKSIHFHSLRHSFASNLAQKGVPLYTIKELLGHSSISTTEIYSHLNMDSLREAINKLDTTPSCVLPLTKVEKSVVKIFRINSGE